MFLNKSTTFDFYKISGTKGKTIIPTPNQYLFMIFYLI